MWKIMFFCLYSMSSILSLCFVVCWNHSIYPYSSGNIHWPLQWRHNGRDSISNHQPHDCLLNRLFRHRSKETSKLRVTGLCAGNSPVTGEFPAQMASNAENASIWWRHHEWGNYDPLIPNHNNTQHSWGILLMQHLHHSWKIAHNFHHTFTIASHRAQFISGTINVREGIHHRAIRPQPFYILV